MQIERKPGSYVILETAKGRKQEFEVNHAERILRDPSNGGWRLPEDSPYKFDYYDGITKRAGSQGYNSQPKEEENY